MFWCPVYDVVEAIHGTGLVVPTREHRQWKIDLGEIQGAAFALHEIVDAESVVLPIANDGGLALDACRERYRNNKWPPVARWGGDSYRVWK